MMVPKMNGAVTRVRNTIGSTCMPMTPAPKAIPPTTAAQAGLAVKNSSQRSATYHNARPQWLLQHGRAARQDLATCATCHQQTYCMQCHSQLGSRISPHGPGFDAARMSAKNSQTCLVCHFKNPLAK